MQFALNKIATVLAASVFAGLLVSCGGEGGTTRHITEVITFGDSLSDVGTYAPRPTLTAGVKFTTNPAALWTEIVATSYGAQLAPNAFVRFNPELAVNPNADISKNVASNTAGTSYAQGSARVSLPSVAGLPPSFTGSAPNARPLVGNVVPAGPNDVIVGYSINPANGQVFAAAQGTPTAFTAVSVKDQISNYLVKRSKFAAHQLVLIQGGANDVFVALATAPGGLAPNPAACGGALFNPTADNAVTCAGKEMATQLKRLVDNGATNVVYANLPDIGNTPEFVLNPNPAARTNATILSNAYNQAVAGSLQALGVADRIRVYDTLKLLTDTLANPPAGTVSTPNAKFACKGPANPGSATGVTSLGCNADVATGSGFQTPNAPYTYVFADGVHPSLLGHQIWGNAAASFANARIPL